jgi:DNA-binding NtrC family response regulator
MAINNFLIFNSCNHQTSEQLISILESKMDCHIQLVEGKQRDLDIGNNQRPDLCFWVKDVDGSNGCDLNNNSLSPEIDVLCTKGCGTRNVDLSIDHADDFIVTPLREAEVLSRVGRLVSGVKRQEKETARKNILQKAGISQLIGRDPLFLKKISIIPQIAECDATVLLLGRTGVGKELCARAIHYLSKRSNQPFLPVDCGAIPSNLIENELFGHRKGAFTDAQTNQFGIIAEAEGGTLFLDEIDALPLESQSKLLRLLQDKTYRPLGQAQYAKANVRVIVATNEDLGRKAQQNLFRKDLFYRLTINLELPKLRERASDIPLLAEYFLKKYEKEMGGKPKSLSPASVQKLIMYDWPGNIRELENVIQQAIILSQNTVILPENINISSSTAAADSDRLSFRDAKRKAIDEFEKEYITGLLVFHKGNVTSAALDARKDRSDFSRLMRKFNLDRNSFILEHH